jgi:hypothetical protein
MLPQASEVLISLFLAADSVCESHRGAANFGGSRPFKAASGSGHNTGMIMIEACDALRYVGPGLSLQPPSDGRSPRH